MPPIGFVTLALLWAIVARAVASDTSGLPKEAKILDPDIVLHRYHQPIPRISPDGQWVAYLSKGFVCVCNMKEPVPRRLFEVPNSWTHVLARPENMFARGDSQALSRAVGQIEFDERRSDVTDNVYEIHWTHDSDGVVFSVQSYDRQMNNPEVTAPLPRPTYINRHVSIKGAVTVLSHVGPDALTSVLGGGLLTRDRKYLVSADWQMAHPSHRPLIWDVKNNKPRATCFLYLTPSATSGRWIGIEKDTQQLVVLDEEFEVIKRFEETVPGWSFGFKLDWSPDERFIIWRNQIGFDYYRNWEGFWMDLETGQKRELSGRFMEELFGFTGRGGEYFRCGKKGIRARWPGDQTIGAYLTIVPEGDAAPSDVWRIRAEPNERVLRPIPNLPGSPPLRPAPGCKMFAIGLPRPKGDRSGWVWHLIDRDGNKWRIPGKDSAEWYSPFDVVGFAQGGKTIIAHDKKRLFSLPVSAIKKATND